eukprot:5737668-Pyramimonas_sp.AAC.1
MAGGGTNPALAQYVANQLKDQAAIAKESRKAREEQQAPSRGRGKGRGRGGGGLGPAGEEG